MVITRRTRNPLAFRGPWVRIPPAPPSKKLFAFFGKELFAWKDLFSDASPHPQPVNKAQNALPEIRRAMHHSPALPSYPSQMYIGLLIRYTPKKEKIPEGDLARREICENLRSILREFEPVTYISTSRSCKKYSALRGQSASQASLHLFRCQILLLHRIAASADDRVLRSRKKLSAVSFPARFMTYDLPRKKSH